MELNARRKIYETVLRFPGLHFRGIQRKTNLAVGGLKYNLDVLERRGVVESQRYGRTLRYYPKGIDIESKKFLALLRLKSTRRLLVHLLAHPGTRQCDIARDMELSPSTITWHISRLVDQGVVKMKNKSGERIYFVCRESELRRTLASYKESFLDDMVDAFISLWEL